MHCQSSIYVTLVYFVQVAYHVLFPWLCTFKHFKNEIIKSKWCQLQMHDRTLLPDSEPEQNVLSNEPMISKGITYSPAAP